MEATREIQALSSPVTQGSVVNLVVERIKEALINKELRPGDYLPSETELTRRLGVGKTTVREAVKMLQALGVVDVRRGQGTTIREHPGENAVSPLIFQLMLESGSVQDVLDLRMMFEPAYSIMSLERATEEDLRRIEHTVDEFALKIEQGTHRAEDDIAFHLAILESTHNPLVMRIGQTIMQIFYASIKKSMRTIPEVALRDHKRILAALRQRDREGLLRAIVASFEGWKTSLYDEKAT